MKVITTVAELQKSIATLKAKGKTVGFTPTMGALHEGHMNLINHSKSENDIAVCSIFVNPTQFNESSDLDSYPRTLTADTTLLKQNRNDIVFAPNVEEVYPTDADTDVVVNLEGLDKRMEGAFRPGHFAGVVQVVHRLLDIVKPTTLYMGQKDFQQFTIIAKMLENTSLQVKLRVVPIVRSRDGLALSSRNVRLTATNRELAPAIYKTLKAINRKKYKMSVSELESYAMIRLGKIGDFRPEYVTIVDGYHLTPLDRVADSEYVVVCTAVWAGDVRLIDNLILRKPRSLKIFTKRTATN